MRQIQLEDHIANALDAIARARGLSLNDYLAMMVKQDKDARDDSFDRDLDRLLLDQAKEQTFTHSPLSDDFSRADIYDDHP
ncbi:MAG: hypothetical protein KDB27_33095 [Planctomycetales bacterium]|nr:hypothetical protein [Planctomycetales bacterium]